MDKLRKVWRFVHGIDPHPLNADIKWANREGFMWWLLPTFCALMYTGWLQPTAPVLLSTGGLWALLLFFAALNRRTADLQDTTLGAYEELVTEMQESLEKQRAIMDNQRAEIMAHELRQAGEGEGWKGSASLN